MPSYATARVVSLLSERPGLQRIEIHSADRDIDAERAYVLTQLIGPVGVGDEVIINTTAVDLSLGTGGWHPVHWNLSRRSWKQAGPGHIMKLRYTAMQADTGAFEETAGYTEPQDLDGIPVVVCLLHSQVAAVAAAIRTEQPTWKIGYIMTDQAALPYALSDLAFELRAKDLLNVSISAGQAFGADLEAVNVRSAMGVAKSLNVDALIVGQGPGVVGTGTHHGFSGLECAAHLTTAATYGGRPIFAMRWSDADARERHRGLSHHSSAVLANTITPVQIAVPPSIPLGRADPHHIVAVEERNVEAMFTNFDLHVTSMGRTPAEDPGFFACAAAAGTLAAQTASNVKA